MIHILASGSLIGAPQRRTSAKGTDYCTANLRVSGKDGESAYVSLIAFNEDAAAELLALSAGDAVAISGPGKITTWTGKDGTEKHGLSVVVERVIPNCPKPKAARPKPKPVQAPAMAQGEFDDDLPF